MRKRVEELVDSVRVLIYVHTMNLRSDACAVYPNDLQHGKG